MTDPPSSGNDPPAAAWRQLEAMVDRCLQLPGSQRAGFLLDQCGDDRARLERALDLLLATAEADGIETPQWLPRSDRRQKPALATPSNQQAPAADLLGLPGFSVLETLGEGGMGTVYLADQLEPVRRRVALKIARTPLGEAGQVRLAAERQAMARLSHANIAQILDAGSTPDGHPFFAMEWIDGPPITEACDLRRLDLEARLRLFLGVCDGVQHAHQKGILHRDLKPSNVLVSEDDLGRPVAKIIDFGIAKALDETLLAGGTASHGNLVGTPAYMSPEALLQPELGGAPSPDTRSDVYSLGVLLYELLVGERPVPRRSDENPLLYLQRVAEAKIVSPHRRWRALEEPIRQRRAAARGCDARSFERRLHGDLEWIVRKAVAREADARYASVSELAADLGRHLAHEPVLAGPPSALYRLRKLARRHRGAVATAALVFLALAGGLVARSLEAARANREAIEARAARDESKQTVNFLIDLFAAAAPEFAGGRELTATEILQQGVERLEDGALGESPRARVKLLFATANTVWQLGHPAKALSVAEVGFAVAEAETGPDSVDAAHGLYLVGTLASEVGDYPRSEDLLRRALERHKALYGEQSPQVANVLMNLGAIHEETTRYQAAIPIYRRALAIRDHHFGSESLKVASVEGNLAIIYWRLHRLDEAIAHHRRSLAIHEKALPAHDPAIMRSMNNLADVLRDAGHHEEAEALLLDTLARLEPVVGAEHPDLGTAWNSLGNVYKATGRFDEAEQAYLRAESVYASAVGPEHRWVAYPVDNLGLLYANQGRFEDAEACHRRALEIRRRDDTSPLDTAESLLGLAQALRARGHLDEAETLLQQALERFEKSPAAERGLRQAVAELGLLALDRGRLDSAETYLLRARSLSAEGHESLATSLAGLARLALARGHRGEARELAGAARRALEGAVPPGHFKHGEIERSLADLRGDK